LWDVVLFNDKSDVTRKQVKTMKLSLHFVLFRKTACFFILIVVLYKNVVNISIDYFYEIFPSPPFFINNLIAEVTL